MARITVEDCIDKVDNRFQLIMIAAHRARMIGQGQPILVDRDNDKNTVVALREIADECIRPDDIEEQLLTGLQRHVESDEPEPNAAGLLPFDEEDADIEFDQMSEADLLKGLASMDMLGPKNSDGF